MSVQSQRAGLPCVEHAQPLHCVLNFIVELANDGEDDGQHERTLSLFPSSIWPDSRHDNRPRPGSTAIPSKQVELRRPPAVGKRPSQIAAAVDAPHCAALLSRKSIPPSPKNSTSGLVLSGAMGGGFVEELRQTPGNPPRIAYHGMITDVALESLSGHSGRRTSAALGPR